MARNQLLVLLLSLVMAMAAGVAAADGEDMRTHETDETDHDETDDDDAGSRENSDEERDDERDSDDAETERRRVEVEADDEGVSFELERESRSSEDKIEASFRFEDATFEVEYEAEAGDNETESSLEAQFQTLIEYRDSDGDGRYSPGDEVVSAYALGDGSEDFEIDGEADWQTPSISDITSGNHTGKRIDAPARIGDNGTFELRFFVFGDFVDLGAASLEPTSIKVDIIIEAYPYAAEGTALALIIETESESEFEHDHHALRDDEEGVATGGAASLVFSWKTHAEVDGVSTAVETTSLGMKEEMESDEDGAERKVEERFALSYERGDRIVHDPEARLSIQSDSGEAVGVPGPGLVLVAAGLAAAAAVVRRRV